MQLADDVVDATTFRGFVQTLVASLDEALSLPEPGPYVEQRGEWTNWELDPFLDGMERWLIDTRQWPPPFATEPVWELIFPRVRRPDLKSYLWYITHWTERTSWEGVPAAWSLAARALRAGTSYE